MDEVSTGLDEMALRSPDGVFPHRDGHVATVEPEACGCAEVARNDSVGDLSTPLHRCKGRHHLPIIGEEMQGDMIPKVALGKPHSKEDLEARAQEGGAGGKDYPAGCSHCLDPSQSCESVAISCDSMLQSCDFLVLANEKTLPPGGCCQGHGQGSQGQTIAEKEEEQREWEEKKKAAASSATATTTTSKCPGAGGSWVQEIGGEETENEAETVIGAVETRGSEQKQPVSDLESDSSDSSARPRLK